MMLQEVRSSQVICHDAAGARRPVLSCQRRLPQLRWGQPCTWSAPGGAEQESPLTCLHAAHLHP